MRRDTDGWHLDIVAFGGPSARADEKVAGVSGMKELRNIPLKGAGWELREFGLSLDAKEGRDVPVHVTILAYLPAKEEEFVPDLSTADGLLLVETGNAALDTRILVLAIEQLAKRLGDPPQIVERAAGGNAKDPLRTLVKRVVKAPKDGAIDEFWRQNAQRAAITHDEEVFGALTKERIMSYPSGELVAFLLSVVRARGRRAVAFGRLPNTETFEASLGARWQRLLAVDALEMLVRDAGIAALFGAPGDRALPREEVVMALAGLKRIRVPKKAELIERALGMAREANLWEGPPDATAAAVLEELSARFYAIDDEPLRQKLEDDVRKAPDEFTLPAYVD